MFILCFQTSRKDWRTSKHVVNSGFTDLSSIFFSLGGGGTLSPTIICFTEQSYCHIKGFHWSFAAFTGRGMNRPEVRKLLLFYFYFFLTWSLRFHVQSQRFLWMFLSVLIPGVGESLLLSESVRMCRPLDPLFSPRVDPPVGYSKVKHTPVGYYFFIWSHSLGEICEIFISSHSLWVFFCDNLILWLG